ncbi:hypothetical protein [Nocardia carnea]|uniref:Uncharacterized protein n=1 Tax=Nocardia carnea TaxID=37328 RepID=A0ABW7TS38_9NOCA|nr:hypothetical protein [Nocardia carnea]
MKKIWIGAVGTFGVAFPLLMGLVGAAPAGAADPAGPMGTASAGYAAVQVSAPALENKPKKITVKVRCDQVVNGTPANGHSEKKVEGEGRAYNRADAQKAAEKDVDSKMPPGRHKRHCHVI